MAALLEAFHTSVQLYQAPAELSVAELRQRIGDRLSREQRLIIHPDFFIALKQHLPQISHVEIQLKRGHYQEECFFSIRFFNNTFSPSSTPENENRNTSRSCAVFATFVVADK